MDPIKSWSSFEGRQRNNNVSETPSTIGASVVAERGFEALLVSASSPDLAPSAAALLRQSGLAAAPVGNHRGLGSRKADDCDDHVDFPKRDDEEEEFQFRFHWIRPHPYLAFLLEGELATPRVEGGMDDVEAEKETPSTAQGEGAIDKNNAPAIESARLVEAYRSSQVKVQSELNADSSPKEAVKERNVYDVPLDLPELRINLANLVEPPLMLSWLPGEDS